LRERGLAAIYIRDAVRVLRRLLSVFLRYVRILCGIYVFELSLMTASLLLVSPFTRI